MKRYKSKFKEELGDSYGSSYPTKGLLLFYDGIEGTANVNIAKCKYSVFRSPVGLIVNDIAKLGDDAYRDVLKFVSEIEKMIGNKIQIDEGTYAFIKGGGYELNSKENITIYRNYTFKCKGISVDKFVSAMDVVGKRFGFKIIIE